MHTVFLFLVGRKKTVCFVFIKESGTEFHMLFFLQNCLFSKDCIVVLVIVRNEKFINEENDDDDDDDHDEEEEEDILFQKTCISLMYDITLYWKFWNNWRLDN